MTDAPRKPRTAWGRLSLPTRILIGMAVGVVFGVLLGPRSLVLQRDALDYPDGAKVALRIAPDPEAAPLALKAGQAVRLEVTEIRQGTDGQPWFRVRVPVGAVAPLPQAKTGPGATSEGKAAPPAAAKATPVAPERAPAGWRIAYVPRADAPHRVSTLGVRIMAWVRPFGRLFLRLIKMVIVPLVFASLLLGVASLGDLGKLGRLGGATLGYFMATTMLAITLGLTLANVVNPGRAMEARDRDQLSRAYADDAREAQEKEEKERQKGNFLDRVVDMVPEVPLHAATDKNPNMLQVIVFALILGIGLILIPAEKAAPALAFFDSINEVMIRIVILVMELAPYGVLALLADVAGSAGLSVLGALAAYSGVVLLALFLHGTVTYGLAVRFLSRYSLRRFYRGIREAQLIAFSTSSSSATLPVSIRIAETELGVSAHTAGFVLPLGATINMDGTALYQGVAAVFIAQVFGMDLTVTQQLEVLFTATLASVGAAGVPGAGIVTLAMVLTSIGVPTAGIALILGVDRLLDMFRTAVNVTGDLSCAVFVGRLAGDLDEVAPDPEDPTAPEDPAPPPPAEPPAGAEP